MYSSRLITASEMYEILHQIVWPQDTPWYVDRVKMIWDHSAVLLYSNFKTASFSLKTYLILKEMLYQELSIIMIYCPLPAQMGATGQWGLYRGSSALTLSETLENDEEINLITVMRSYNPLTWIPIPIFFTYKEMICYVNLKSRLGKTWHPGWVG